MCETQMHALYTKLGSLGQAPRKFKKIALCKIESMSIISGYFTLADLHKRVTVYVHGIANNLIFIPGSG